MRILYIEDNALDADLTKRFLARADGRHRVEVAGSLAEAWARLASTDEPYDLALVDLDLPDGSGIEFVIGVRERDLPLAVVMLTGSGDERSAVAALKAGADDYLVKGGDHLAQIEEVSESARAAFRAGRARRTRPLRVLYCEHNTADVDLVRRHLARHAPHIQLDTVTSGDDVLTRLDRPGTKPDVLLLDYRLRGLNAIELIALLQAGSPTRIPVVVVTGQGDEAVAVRALRAGAADYLVKHPGYLHELAATLENTHHRALLWREQAALRASEQRFRQLAEHIDEVFWISQPNNAGVLYVNPAFAKVWGRPCEYAFSSPTAWLDTLVPEDRPAVLAWQAAVLAEGPRVVEYRIQHPDGQTRWIRDRASPVRDAEGQPYRVVGVAEDITARRQLEEQLRQAQKMEAIGQLSGGVAHDFNNLLTIIQGHLGLIEKSGGFPSEAANSLGQISQAATRATNLTRQLLTFSRKQPMQTRYLDLRTVVTDLAKMLQRILGEDVQLHVEAGEEALWVHADPGMMEQVLMNFMVNARDAMPSGGRLEIRLAPARAEELATAEPTLENAAEGWAASGYLRLAVSDTGTGMTPEVLARAFEPFFTTKPVGKGTGLGLATVYGIIRQHRGTIVARSEPGQGSVFEVYLPRVAPSPATPSISRCDEQTKDLSSPHPTGQTILLVEDDSSVSSMVQLALEWAGYRILCAANGHEALALWAAHRDEIDLLLTDFVMPEGMSGRDLGLRVLADRPGLPLIYMSGYSAEIAGRDAESDVTNSVFLPKPFGVEALNQAVRAALNSRPQK